MLFRRWWFGSDCYTIEGHLVLSSGRRIPAEGESFRCGEGVAVILVKFCQEVWHVVVYVWKSYSSSLVRVRLKFSDRERFRLSSSYVPTFSSPCNIEEEFYQTLQAALRDVKDGEKYILLGDFNAQIGSREFEIDTDDPWWEVRGPHGYGTLNSSGRELLNFFSSNNATVCNTWFRKRHIYKGTWRHLRSGQWKCIDFTAVAQAHRQFCLDVQVLRSAECGSDHNLLCAHFALRRRLYHFPRTGINRRRFDIGKF